MATPEHGRVERRLTAILAADVAGYSRLTSIDEEGTHAQLQDHLRSLVDPKIAEHRGRIVKNTGDGMLAEFSSVVDAVRCALDIQRGGNRIRIAGQLIDASTNAHLWADRFEGGLEDIFDLQDQVTISVVGAIAPKLEQAEIERAKRKPTERLDAYDYYLRVMASRRYQRTKESNSEALSLFYRAIELDPDFASAYGRAAGCYGSRGVNRWMADPQREVAEAARLARR